MRSYLAVFPNAMIKSWPPHNSRFKNSPAMLIHIGYHKTGTSYLQRYVFFKTPPTNFVAPWTICSGEAIQHFVLTHPLRFDPVAVRAEFQSKLPAENTAAVPVISHEDLSGVPTLA